jgi:hypothetical protein
MSSNSKASIPVWVTHEVIRLTSEQADFTVIIERRPDPKKIIVAIARESAPYDRLKVDATKGGSLTFDVGNHKDSLWTIFPTTSTSNELNRYVHLRSNARMNGGAKKQAGVDDSCYWWLGGKAGCLCSVEGGADQPPLSDLVECTWKAEAVPSLFERLQLKNDLMDSLSGMRLNPNHTAPHINEAVSTVVTDMNRELSDEEISRFVSEGYIVRKALAPMPLVCAALSVINARLGYGNKVSQLSYISFCLFFGSTIIK